MSVESVKKFFTEQGLVDPVFKLEECGATVDLAAKTLGIEPKFIAKTLSFRLKDRDILIVTKGDARIDNRKYKDFFKTKAKMLDHDEVAQITGHPVGGVCPFGLASPIGVYIDVSLKDYEYVYPAAGSAFTALKIRPSDMQNLTQAEFVDVCK
ncbi:MULTISPECIES: YbaK/EbsC family protein [Clostridium]|uniref:YbaK/EbsC family protein n=1 Tax=Clostridium frigoriphilum TaxID=443253 RepID=A0ABU7UJ40_9CLOT|nr:YbaK/EbsC family protein [Clostridium sp. DSM 17811]MBU3099070.1 YbaK/EbsC family protein [Clostridium sp. DSM 17811]